MTQPYIWSLGDFDESTTQRALPVDIGKGLTILVEWQRFTREVLEYAITKGLGNILMDAHSAIKRADFESDEAWREASLAASQKKLDSMYAGKCSALGKRKTRSGNPFDAEVRKIALEDCNLYFKGQDLKDEAILKAFNDMLEFIKASDETRAEAKRRIESREAKQAMLRQLKLSLGQPVDEEPEEDEEDDEEDEDDEADAA